MHQIDDPILGAVVIGRNEGARLLTCLASVLGQVSAVVYVDSGSSDGSVQAAQAMGVQVVPLDMALPFTAARARNAGLAALAGDVTHVQFLDGDCELQPGWLAPALAFLSARPDVAVVCGRRRERAPEATIFNLICDREWNTPLGEALACGGDALMRRDALTEVGGYRDDLIAGEEPELCQRLRRKGWRIWRLDLEMTLHDAAITRLGQWWQRSRRAGHAFAEGAALHGAGPDRHWVRETRRAVAWGAVLPAATLAATGLAGAGWAGAWVLGVWALWPAQWLRLTLRQMRQDPPLRAAKIAGLSVLGKLAEAQGAVGYYAARFRRTKPRIIEYK